MKKHPVPTAEDVDALLSFLPAFGTKAFQFGKFHFRPGVFPDYEISVIARRFIKAAHDHNWIIVFDWPRWQREAARYAQGPALLKCANLFTLQKLLTTHIRKERFCDGHLAAMYECGHITAILRRLERIRKRMRSRNQTAEGRGTKAGRRTVRPVRRDAE